MDFREFLRQGFVVLDGATGSNLQQAGMKSGDCPEQWIAKHPEVFIDLQCRYIEAGSDVLYTPTFTCNRIKLDEYGSFVWQQIDGKKSIYEIGKEIGNKHNGASDQLYERLSKYFGILERNKYIVFEK